MTAPKKPARRRTRENTLWVVWSKKEKDLLFHHPDFKANAALLNYYLCSPRLVRDYSGDGRGFSFDPSLVEELEKRGYDITTLRFSIMKKAPPEEGGAP